jgi:hypothetical protein
MYHEKLAALQLRLARLASISEPDAEGIADEALASCERKLTKLGASATNLSATQREVAARTGTSPEDVALLQAKARVRAEAETALKAIPHEKQTLLRVLVGDDPVAMVEHWQRTQRALRDGKAGR